MLRLQNLLIATLSLLIVTAIAAPGFGQAKKEALDATGMRFDFGYVPINTTIKHRATLFNQCDSVVNITRVVPGCGCTQIPLKTKVLAPGDSVEVEMLFDTGKIHAGLFEKAPVIYTDNRETPRVTFHIYGFNLQPDDVQPKITILPQKIAFSKAGADKSVAIAITNSTTRPITARLADDTTPSYLKVVFPDTQIGPGQKDTVTVKFIAANLPESKADESITLVFNDMKQTRWTIPISIQ